MALHDLERLATSELLVISDELSGMLLTLVFNLEDLHQPLLENLDIDYKATEECITELRKEAGERLKTSA